MTFFPRLATQKWPFTCATSGQIGLIKINYSIYLQKSPLSNIGLLHPRLATQKWPFTCATSGQIGLIKINYSIYLQKSPLSNIGLLHVHDKIILNATGYLWPCTCSLPLTLLCSPKTKNCRLLFI